MDRKAFLRTTVRGGFCCGALLALPGERAGAEETPAGPGACSEATQRAAADKEFIDHWLTDLLDTMDTTLDEPTRIRLIEGCGQGCYRRHQFKQNIAAAAQGDLDKLLEAYKKNFEVWRDGETVHIRYGEVSKICYCPVVRDRHPGPNDLHCHCTKATHRTIFETALGRPFDVEIVESVRRGGKTCHFLVHLA